MKLGNFELNTTHCLDNVSGLRQLPDACIDLTVTSPPYDDMDLDFNPVSKNGLRTYEGYTWDFKGLATELYRVTKPGGIVVWVVNDPTVNGSESLASSLQKIYFRRVGWNIHDTMIYQTDKPPVNDKRYQPCFEYMIILSKGAPGVFNSIKTKSTKFGSKTTVYNGHRDKAGEFTKRKQNTTLDEYRTKDNIWWFYVGQGKDDPVSFEHPARFAEALARDHILSWSNPGDIVLDPFSGSGTTGKMAKQNGRLFIGFEISQKYTDLANKRMAAAQPPLFVDTPPAPVAHAEQAALFG